MKLLVTDFDGTLYTDDYNKNIEALNKFKQKGNKVVIATGRYLSSLKEDLDKRIDYDYLICTDGSIIYDNNDNVFYKELIDKESCEYITNQLRKLEEVNNIYCLNGDKLLDYDEYDSTNAIIASFEDRKIVEKHFENILKEVPSLNGYISTKWINITSKKASKKTAIDIIASRLKLSKNDVIVFGDNINDIDMINYYDGYIVIKEHDVLDGHNNKKVNNIYEIIDKL